MSQAQRDYLTALVSSRDQDAAMVCSARAILRHPDKVTKATASKHISALKEMPTTVSGLAAKTAVTATAYGASEALKAVGVAMTEGYSAGMKKAAAEVAALGNTLSKKPEYSFKNLPTVGFYDMFPEHDGTFKSKRFWKVYKNQYGSLVAKVLITKYATKSGYGWQTVSLSSFFFWANMKKTNCTKMDQNSVAAFGKKISFCMICGKTLTDPASIEAGIGPVCSKGWQW